MTETVSRSRERKWTDKAEKLLQKYVEKYTKELRQEAKRQSRRAELDEVQETNVKGAVSVIDGRNKRRGPVYRACKILGSSALGYCISALLSHIGNDINSLPFVIAICIIGGLLELIGIFMDRVS